MSERLLRKLRARLNGEALELIREVFQGRFDDDAWDDEAVRRRALQLEEQVTHLKQRLSRGDRDLCEAPRGRQLTVLNSSPPSMMIALIHHLVDRSSHHRFALPKRSLECAELALEAAVSLHDRDLIPEELSHDMLTEAWITVGNARRLVGDLPAAEEAFQSASKHRKKGTGDRQVHAEYLRLLACLRHAQGEAESAVALLDRQIRLRRLLGDEPGLGIALIDRGIFGAWCEPIETAARFMAEGVRRIDDRRMMLAAAYAFAEQQARAGRGLESYRSLCAAESAALLAGDRSFERVHRWVGGIAHRVLGELELAEKDLSGVRDAYVEEGNAPRAAFVSLDLTAVYVAQGRHQEAVELIREAYAAFVAERAERHALTAFRALQQAAEASELTEALAVEVANFMVRSQYNRKLEFEVPNRR